MGCQAIQFTVLCGLLIVFSVSAVWAARLTPPGSQIELDSQLKEWFPHFGGFGWCLDPVKDASSDLIHVQCLGPPMKLQPGEATPWDLYILLGNPYPADSWVQVTSMTSQLVNDKLEPVPLSEVYVHHYVGNRNFILGEGSEIRGSLKRAPLPEPYGYLVDGREVQDIKYRFCNIQLINTVGVKQEDRKACLECWCDEKPTQGSFTCCKQCPSSLSNTTVSYMLQHNVTYRRISDNHGLKPVTLMGFDVVSGNIEYNVLEPAQPNTTHTMSRSMILDHQCPQTVPFEVVRCTAHQHWGGQCMELIEEGTGRVLCRSCPEVGTQADAPGNELGYVVRMIDDDLDHPVTLQPGTRVTLTSMYDASVQRLGVMGLMTVWVAGADRDCGSDFNALPSHGGARSHPMKPTDGGAMGIML